MKLSSAKRPNKGKQCDRGPAKQEIIKHINQLNKIYNNKNKYVIKKLVSSIFRKTQ